jgi:hypothetical protein
MRDLRRGAVVVALTALVAGARLAAQVPPGATPRERELLLRADSFYRLLEARLARDAEAQRVRSRAKLVESGGLALVVSGEVPVDEALHALDSAQVILRGFGGVPERFTRSLVVVFQDATDTGLALRAGTVRDRRRVPVTGIQQSVKGPHWTISGSLIAGVLARAYRASLDPDWREWLPWDYGFGPWGRGAAGAAYTSLTRSPWSVSASCLAALPAGCRLWLGVDRDQAPYEARYTGVELRRTILEGAKWYAERSESGRSCLDGADAACYTFARDLRWASPFPADDPGRRSLIRAVHDLHGPGAVAQALADTAGAIGERLARASGVGEDSLMMEWRYWVLTRGGRPSERNVLADAAPAVLLAGLLLAVARRSRG